MKSLNLALTVTAVCSLLVSAAPTAAVCEDGLISIEGGAQRMARCVPFQAFRQVSVKEDNEEANIIEPRGGGHHDDHHDDECRDSRDKDDCKRRKKGDKHKKKKGKDGKHGKKGKKGKQGKKEKCEKEPKHPECRDEDEHDDHHDDHRGDHKGDHHGDHKGDHKGDHHDDDCPEEFRGGPDCPWFKHEEPKKHDDCPPKDPDCPKKKHHEEPKHDDCEKEPHKPSCRKDKKKKGGKEH